MSTAPQQLGLTAREEEVLRLMSAGQTNRQIAGELVVTIETVRWYTKQIYGKLGVHGRTQAVLRSRELGLFQASSPRIGHPSPKAAVKLPQYPTPFVGRSRELEEIGRLLLQPETRLVTIAGPGGTGKTRFCVELARLNSTAFVDGVYFIPLAPIDTVEEAMSEIAHILRIPLTSRSKPTEQIATFLNNRNLLLVLDNIEHLPEASEWIQALLTSTQRPKFLVSSQVSLNISAEWTRYLGGIPYPEITGDDAGDYPAVQLFTERALRVRADFDPRQNLACVVKICRQLHGLPLGLELAATWLKTLACNEITAELERAPESLTSRYHDTAARHQSLQAVFDYSWKLLTNQERRVLLRLSPFRGGFNRITAEKVANADLETLSSLVDKSFLTHVGQGTYLFHELARQYALDLLEQQGDALTTRSGKLLLWSLFIKGDFGRAEQLAEEILSRSVPGTADQAFGLALTGVLAGMSEDYGDCQRLCKVAHSLITKTADFEDTLSEIFIHLGLAVAGCGMGEYVIVQEHTRLTLRVAATLQSPAFVLLCLPLAAIYLAHNAETEQAVELLSLTLNHPAHTPAWLEKWPLLTQLQADMMAELGQDLYDNLWESGKTADLENKTTAVLSMLR